MADSKLWIWLLIFGLLFLVVGIIALVMDKRSWWVWTLLGIGGLLLLGGLIAWIMNDHDAKTITIGKDYGTKFTTAATHGTTSLMTSAPISTSPTISPAASMYPRTGSII